MEADFLQSYFAEFSEETPQALYVGGRLFPVKALHLDDLTQGLMPNGVLPRHLQLKARKEKKTLSGMRIGPGLTMSSTDV